MEQPTFSEPLHLNGLSDEAVIQVAKELSQATGIETNDISTIDTRDEALHVLWAITQVARNNPLISVLEATGEVPSAKEVAALASV
jgi:hypothetical protein